MTDRSQAREGDGVLDDLWRKVLREAKRQMDPHLYDTWLRPTRLVARSESGLLVCVPNDLFAEWVASRYRDLLLTSARAVGLATGSIEFVTPESSPDVEADAPRGDEVPAPAAGPAAPAPPGLNPRYRFESFVVSSCNQFAHAAATAVADNPSHSYNPLYIYGGVGLGKTHLMQAIGTRLAECRPDLNVRYLSTETFMNELISSIRHETTYEFKERYRGVDVLLMDDIQFIAGKESTQEEFFHTFNALYDAEKQIVINSDCPPRAIPTIEERLRSRFEWGLIADIQMPDLETKIAILNKKAESENLDLPPDVALFIASRIQSNIRELEGSLIRVLAYASTQRRPLDLELAKETLKDLLRDEAPLVTIETIQKHVANYYSLRVSELKSRSNAMRVAFPRQVAMYLCKMLTSASLPEIGSRFGGKHHSTVIHGIRKITRKRKEDRDFDRLVEGLAQSLQ